MPPKAKLLGSDSSSSSPAKRKAPTTPSKKRGQLATSGGASTGKGATLNAGIIAILAQLGNNEKSAGRIYKSTAYFKAVNSLKRIDKKIESGREAEKLEGIGKKIAAKIDEILATGQLQRLEQDKKDPRQIAINELNRVTGIGPKFAARLIIDHGITSLDQLRKNQHLLNAHQKLGLQFVEDFTMKIPRTEIQQMERYVKAIAADVDPELLLTICGSYRRGTEKSGDIDILLTKKSWHSGSRPSSMSQFVKRLEKEGFITHELGFGDKKFSGVCRLESVHKAYADAATKFAPDVDQVYGTKSTTSKYDSPEKYKTSSSSKHTSSSSISSPSKHTSSTSSSSHSPTARAKSPPHSPSPVAARKPSARDRARGPTSTSSPSKTSTSTSRSTPNKGKTLLNYFARSPTRDKDEDVGMHEDEKEHNWKKRKMNENPAALRQKQDEDEERTTDEDEEEHEEQDEPRNKKARIDSSTTSTSTSSKDVIKIDEEEEDDDTQRKRQRNSQCDVGEEEEEEEEEEKKSTTSTGYRPHRRIDVRFFPYDNYHYAVLYFTGSDNLNRDMRVRAIERGMTLNEYRLCKVYDDNTHGPDIPAESERHIFELLGMDYLPPNQRSL